MDPGEEECGGYAAHVGRRQSQKTVCLSLSKACRSFVTMLKKGQPFDKLREAVGVYTVSH
jgi:hypothetical protein